MPNYNSNINEVILSVKGKLNKVQSTKLQREIATSLKSSNQDRIHGKGLKVDGGLIGGGSYSAAYEKKRKNLGKATDIINLSFDGNLSKELIIDEKGKEFQLVIRNISGREFGSDERAEAFEERWGQIWGVTKSDRKVIDQVVDKHIKKALNGGQR